MGGLDFGPVTPRCGTWGRHYLSLSHDFLLSRVRGPTGSRASFTGLKWASVREHSGSHQAQRCCGQALVWECFYHCGFYLWVGPKSLVTWLLSAPQVPEWRSSCMRSWTGRYLRESPMGSCWLSIWQKRPVSWGPPLPMVSQATRPSGPHGPRQPGHGLLLSHFPLSPSLPSFMFLITHIIPEFILFVKTSNSGDENSKKKWRSLLTGFGLCAFFNGIVVCICLFCYLVKFGIAF